MLPWPVDRYKLSFIMLTLPANKIWESSLCARGKVIGCVVIAVL